MLCRSTLFGYGSPDIRWLRLPATSRVSRSGKALPMFAEGAADDPTTSFRGIAMIYALALLIGIVAGLRALTPLAAVSWAARGGDPALEGTLLAFVGYRWTPWVTTLLALGELVTDKLPSTPSRKVPMQFATRVVVGTICGAALAIPAGVALGGAVLGAVGAVIGTLGGAAVRGRLAAAFGSDRPAALIEDLVAIIAAILIVRAA
jgi:uncharacterized membrane protein